MRKLVELVLPFFCEGYHIGYILYIRWGPYPPVERKSFSEVKTYIHRIGKKPTFVKSIIESLYIRRKLSPLAITR